MRMTRCLGCWSSSDVVRKRKLENRLKDGFRKSVHGHIRAAEVVFPPRFGDARGRRREPHIVLRKVMSESASRRIQRGHRVQELHGLHLSRVLIDHENDRLESFRPDRATVAFGVTLETLVKTEKPNVGQ